MLGKGTQQSPVHLFPKGLKKFTIFLFFLCCPQTRDAMGANTEETISPKNRIDWFLSKHIIFFSQYPHDF